MYRPGQRHSWGHCRWSCQRWLWWRQRCHRGLQRRRRCHWCADSDGGMFADGMSSSCHSWMKTYPPHEAAASPFSLWRQRICFWIKQPPFSHVSAKDQEVQALSWQGGGNHGLSRGSSGADHSSSQSCYRCRLFYHTATREGVGLRVENLPLRPGLSESLVARMSPLAGRSSSRVA